jgi:excisionase family DNA binding protein
MTQQKNPRGVDLEDLQVETSVAAKMLGVPTRTLVRMADRGRIPCERTPGEGKGAGHRRFRLSDVQELREKGAPEIDRANPSLTQEELDNTYSTAEVQEILNVGAHTLRRWEREGTITAHRPTVANKIRYDKATIEEIVWRRENGYKVE